MEKETNEMISKFFIAGVIKMDNEVTKFNG
jgi:hypothetical protein